MRRSRRERPKLLVLAPPRLTVAARRALAASGLRALVEPISFQSATRLRERVQAVLRRRRMAFGGVVIVTSRPGMAARAMGGPCLLGIPVGIVPCARAEDLDVWSRCLRQVRHPMPAMGVMSMWNRYYLGWSNRFARALREGYGKRGARVGLWSADRVYPESLCRRLGRGLGLGLYAGHGRVRGWSGYRGLRWRHIAAVEAPKPVACLIALTCDTLNFDTGRGAPFGANWVLSGRCAAYLAPAEGVPVEPLEPIGEILSRVFHDGRCRRLSSMVRTIEREVRALRRPDVVECWEKFRIVGNPIQRFF